MFHIPFLTAPAPKCELEKASITIKHLNNENAGNEVMGMTTNEAASKAVAGATGEGQGEAHGGTQNEEDNEQQFIAEVIRQLECQEA